MLISLGNPHLTQGCRDLVQVPVAELATTFDLDTHHPRSTCLSNSVRHFYICCGIGLSGLNLSEENQAKERGSRSFSRSCQRAEAFRRGPRLGTAAAHPARGTALPGPSRLTEAGNRLCVRFCCSRRIADEVVAAHSYPGPDSGLSVTGMVRTWNKHRKGRRGSTHRSDPIWAAPRGRHGATGFNGASISCL